jgi:hypothetical protein
LAIRQGLAKGSSDQGLTFDTLVRLMQKQELKRYNLSSFAVLLLAFMPAILLVSEAPKVCIRCAELKQYFVNILSATPIAPWGTKKLIELAKAGELEAWRFQR